MLTYKEITLNSHIEGDNPGDRVMTDTFTADSYLIEREGNTVSITHIREWVTREGKKAPKFSDKTIDFPWASVRRAVR